MNTIKTILIFSFFSCAFTLNEEKQDEIQNEEAKPCLMSLSPNFKTGAQQFDKVVEHLRTKKIGLIANPSSQINGTHLVDTMLSSDLALQRIFCPEHGFRGEGAAGEKINSSVDSKTGLPIISLYGKK